jgi:succinate-acetate transporter protein
MIAILGFVIATLTAGILDLFAPDASHATIWLYLVSFGGLLQIYAGIKDFHHGNTLTACIFLLFGFHWVSSGILSGDLLFIQSVGSTAGQVVDQSVIGSYYIALTLFELLLTVCCYLNPQGSYLLVAILVIVQGKLILTTINCWTPHTSIKQTSGFLGILVCLFSFYSFFAESLAEHGTLIPTGKFAGVKSRVDVKAELLVKKKRH